MRNLERVLRLKLKQHPDLAEELRLTGDEEIIEDVTRRQHGNALFWGAARRGDRWVGENALGRMWMKLRDELASRPKKRPGRTRPTPAKATPRVKRQNQGGNAGR